MDASVARGWRDVLMSAGVAHRIEVSNEASSPTSFALLVVDADGAAVLADVVEEQPSVDVDVAVRLPRERVDAEPVCAADVDAALFDVPDLLPPPDVQQQISSAGTAKTIGLVLAMLFACAALAVSPWWAVLSVFAGIEGGRGSRRAAARRAEWQQASGWEPPTR